MNSKMGNNMRPGDFKIRRVVLPMLIPGKIEGSSKLQFLESPYKR
jgi:hypothetical protein